MNENATDEQLLQDFRAGDAPAFEALVRRYQDKIFRLASVWLFETEQAEDATQEVFLRSHRGLRSFRFRSTVFTWLYRTTRNVCHEINRRQPAKNLDYESVESAPGPASETSRRQASKRVRQLVQQLPQRQREVVVLRIFEELSVRQTAAIMQCREGTVKALLHKASASLRLSASEAGLVV